MSLSIIAAIAGCFLGSRGMRFETTTPYFWRYIDGMRTYPTRRIAFADTGRRADRFLVMRSCCDDHHNRSVSHRRTRRELLKFFFVKNPNAVLNFSFTLFRHVQGFLPLRHPRFWEPLCVRAYEHKYRTEKSEISCVTLNFTVDEHSINVLWPSFHSSATTSTGQR